jgi:hypothetical protein
MIKKILSILVSALSFSYVCPILAASCGQALPSNDPGFCSSFKEIAQCHCTSSGYPQAMCSDMNQLYSRMVAVYGSQEKACRYQTDTSFQACMDDWNCYRIGGTNSLGQECSSTGKACQ